MTMHDLIGLVERRNEANRSAPWIGAGSKPRSIKVEQVLDLVRAVAEDKPPPHGEVVIAFCGAADLISVRGFRLSIRPAGQALISGGQA